MKEPSLHQTILQEIEGRILSGEWPPGTRIPFEHELTVTYGCSRMTVNKALGELAQRGLIERRRKSGSFVAQPVAQSALLDIRDIRDEVLSLGQDYDYRLLQRSQRPATHADAALIGLPAAENVLSITALHGAGGRPFCLEERLINLSAVPEAADEPFSTLAPGPFLLKQVPWSSAEHRIRAVAASAAAARHLDLAPGTACLVVERRTATGDMPVTFVRLTYPGSLHALVAQFSPAQAMG